MGYMEEEEYKYLFAFFSCLPVTLLRRLLALKKDSAVLRESIITGGISIRKGYMRVPFFIIVKPDERRHDTVAR